MTLTPLVDVTCRRQQYVGKAKFIEYLSAGHNAAARIIIGTEQNVIAAISGHNGHIGETPSLYISFEFSFVNTNIGLYVLEVRNM